MVSQGEGILLGISIVLFMTLVGVVVYFLHKKYRKKIHDAELRTTKSKDYTQNKKCDESTTSVMTSDIHINRNRTKRRHKRRRRQKRVITSSSETGDFSNGVPIYSAHVIPNDAPTLETVGLEEVTLEDIQCQDTNNLKQDPIALKDDNNLERLSVRSGKSDEVAASQKRMASEEEIHMNENSQEEPPDTEDFQISPHSQESHASVESIQPPMEIHRSEENLGITTETKDKEKCPLVEGDAREIQESTLRSRTEEWHMRLKSAQLKNLVHLRLVMPSLCQKYSVDPVLVKYLVGPPKLVGMETRRVTRKQIMHAECRLFRIWRDRCVEETMRQELLKQSMVGIHWKNSGRIINDKAKVVTRQRKTLRRKPKRKHDDTITPARIFKYSEKKECRGGNTNFSEKISHSQIARASQCSRKQTETVRFPQVLGYCHHSKRKTPHKSRNMFKGPSGGWTSSVRSRISLPWSW